MLNKILIFLTLSVLTGFSQEVYAQHHGGEQAPPISFGSGEVTVFSELFPSDFDPKVDSNTDLKIRFFDTITGVNIENVSYRVKIFYENFLVANQMFFDKDGLLEIKIQPKSECDQDELWRCTKYHGENDPVVPNALTSSALSKPVISGPVFDRSGEYTLEVSIIGAKNPKTQTTQDITFQTKIIIPSTQEFTIVSNDKNYQIKVKNFQEQISDITFEESSKSLILQVPIDWSHLEHIDHLKNIIEIPKDFLAFSEIYGISGQANGDQISSKALHFDDVSSNEINIIHLSIANDELNKISQATTGLKLVIKPDTEISKTKKEILFENGYKAKVSHDTKYDQNKESFFAIWFFDKDNNLIPNVRYGYSIKDPNGKETVNTGDSSNLMGIKVPNGSEIRYLKTQDLGVYEMKLVLIGVEFKNFDKFMFGNYNFELSDSQVYERMMVPDWIKNNAKWWAEGQIDDESFVQGIQFMVKNDIIKISETSRDSQNISKEIPDWIKNNAKWWAEGQIDDESFVQGIQFLIKVGIIKLT